MRCLNGEKPEATYRRSTQRPQPVIFKSIEGYSDHGVGDEGTCRRRDLHCPQCYVVATVDILGLADEGGWEVLPGWGTEWEQGL